MSRHEGNRGCIQCGRVTLPVVDQELAVHPESDTIVAVRPEGVGSRLGSEDLSRPANTECLSGDSRYWRPEAPVEVDRRVDSRDRLPSEVGGVEVCRPETIARRRRRIELRLRNQRVVALLG